MTPSELVKAGATYERFCGPIISQLIGNYRSYVDIYTKNSNDLLASKLLKNNSELEDKLRIKRNNQFPGKGSLPDLDYVIADKNKNKPILIISIKGDPNDVKFYSGCWHHIVFEELGIKYAVITKDPKGTFAIKSNGNHTKYFDFFEEDSRLYVDYGTDGYPTTKNDEYADLCSGHVVNPDLYPMVKDMVGFSTDISEYIVSYLKENYSNEYTKYIGKPTIANNNFFNWSSN
jgi:hypothetical protein